MAVSEMGYKMPDRGTQWVIVGSGVLAFLFSAVSGCAVIDQRALQPMDWVDEPVEEFDVTGTDGWSRFRNKPITIGFYSAEVLAQTPWGTLPTSTTENTETTIGLGQSDGSHEYREGTSSTNRDAELALRLSGADGALSQIRCRQLLQTESDKTTFTGSSDHSFSRSKLTKYVSSFNCRSGRASDVWPDWRLDLTNDEPKPLKGFLTVDGMRYVVTGSQSSNLGQGPTMSFDIREGEKTLALIDRAANKVSLHMSVIGKQKSALIGAAVTLLLSYDPLLDGV